LALTFWRTLEGNEIAHQQPKEKRSTARKENDLWKKPVNTARRVDKGLGSKKDLRKGPTRPHWNGKDLGGKWKERAVSVRGCIARKDWGETTRREKAIEGKIEAPNRGGRQEGILDK